MNLGWAGDGGIASFTAGNVKDDEARAAPRAASPIGSACEMTGFPELGALLEGLRANSVRETGGVQREVAVAIAGRESSSETQTLGLDCDWRLTKR